MTRIPAVRAVSLAHSPRDATALGRIAQGDLGELGTLYDRYAGDLLRFVTRVGGATLAEDVVQTVFVRVLTLASSYDTKAASARPWLFGIAARVLQEQRRSMRRWTAALFELAQQRRGLTSAASEGTGDLERAIATLSVGKRAVLLLVEVEGFSGPEVASILSLPLGTVWTRLHHARREVRAFYRERES